MAADCRGGGGGGGGRYMIIIMCVVQLKSDHMLEHDVNHKHIHNINSHPMY